MGSVTFVEPFQERRRLLLGSLFGIVALSPVAGFVGYRLFGVAGALVLAPLCLVLGLGLIARWAHHGYRCPSCQKIPMKVKVRAWTKYTRYLRRLQVSKRFTVYPPWAALFLDLNPARCACGVALAKRGAEYASAT